MARVDFTHPTRGLWTVRCPRPPLARHHHHHHLHAVEALGGALVMMLWLMVVVMPVLLVDVVLWEIQFAVLCFFVMFLFYRWVAVKIATVIADRVG